MTLKRFLPIALMLVCAPILHAQIKTKNVVLIVTDGFRWEDFFTGADNTLLNAKHGGIWADEAALRKQFGASDPKDRRKLLLPFLWSTVAQQGQIFGNQHKGSIAHVTNGYAFSYPGYNEMLTGHGDRKINSNEFGINPNLTVFEWLNKQPDLHGQVAVYGTWSVYNDIFNEPRSQLVMQAGWKLNPSPDDNTDRRKLLTRLYQTSNRFDEDDVDNALLQIPLLDYVRSNHPRVLFVGYGETDNWAHQGRYDLVLSAAHQMDSFVKELWETMQSMPEYRDQTTFIITTDHGRGHGPIQWKEHGVDQHGSENIWIAVIGPDTAPLGERSNIPPVTQSQIAATVAALLGKDFHRDVPEAALPIQSVLSSNP